MAGTKQLLAERPAEWFGTPPKECQICEIGFGDGPAQVVEFVDGRTVDGPWASMCPACHGNYGVGTGIGRGQVYRLDHSSGKWLKVGS